MRLKARLNFTGQWSQIIPEVAKQCGMTVDQYCERAVMLVTKQGLEGGESNAAEQKSEESPHITQQALDATRKHVETGKPDQRHHELQSKLLWETTWEKGPLRGKHPAYGTVLTPAVYDELTKEESSDGSRSQEPSVADGQVPSSQDDSSTTLADTQDTSST